ncbi:UNVERIFIED_CONTAM: Testis-specific serine/threonine-protein kinase 1 [Trichonephila clavipes]
MGKMPPVIRAAVYEDKEVAVKVITRDKLSHEFSTKFLPREIEILSKIHHENIVKARGHLAEKETRHFFGQMVNALKYLHGLNIAHRDLKCENIMIDDNHNIKLIDFGFCRSTGARIRRILRYFKYYSKTVISLPVDAFGRRKLSETFCGSTAYAAPEVLQGLAYNPMMYDVWSLGCVLYIMTTGMMPFDDSHIRKMVTNQLKRHIKFPSNFQISHHLKVRTKLKLDI